MDGEPLTDEELEVLARARGELVAMRGRWLRIDEATREATIEFTKRVAESGKQTTADVLELAAVGRRGRRRQGEGLGRPCARRRVQADARPRR